MSGGLLLLLLGACSSEPAEPVTVLETPTPDVVLIVVDTLRADHLGLYGHSRPTSPAIDGWARGGVVFDDAQAHSGWTLASTASLLTGLLPHEHKAVRDPKQADVHSRLGDEVLTLAEVFRSAGHRTAAFTNNTFLDPVFGLSQGFETYDHRGASFLEHRSAVDTVGQALGWLGKEDAPAFLMVHVMEPHLDYDPPEGVRGVFTTGHESSLSIPFRDHTLVDPIIEGRVVPDAVAQEHVRRAYDEEVLAVDQALAAVFETVAQRQRPAWIVLTADHGEEFWDHGGFEHGHQLFRELVRVPLVVTGPDVQQRRIGAPVSHADLFVTLVELSGASPAHASQGRDLIQVLRGAEDPPTGRVLFAENCMYGSECMSAYRDGQRFIVRPTVGNAGLYRRGPDGETEIEWADPVARDTVGKELYEALVQRRGGLEVIDVGETRVRVAGDTIEQLRAMGYVE